MGWDACTPRREDVREGERMTATRNLTSGLRVSHPRCVAVYQAAKGQELRQVQHAVPVPCTERHAC